MGSEHIILNKDHLN